MGMQVFNSSVFILVEVSSVWTPQKTSFSSSVDRPLYSTGCCLHLAKQRTSDSAVQFSSSFLFCPLVSSAISSWSALASSEAGLPVFIGFIARLVRAPLQEHCQFCLDFLLKNHRFYHYCQRKCCFFKVNSTKYSCSSFTKSVRGLFYCFLIEKDSVSRKLYGF